MPEQEASQLMPCACAGLYRIFSGPGQIADGLIVNARNPDRLQLSSARQVRQAHAIAPIGLDTRAHKLRHQRGRDDLAFEAGLVEFALQAIACRTSFIYDMDLRRISQSTKAFE